jgi:hypothetical protein
VYIQTAGPTRRLQAEDYRRLVERRIALIESDRHIGLVERPEHKRRWSWTPWAEQERGALKHWLLDRIETHFSGSGAWPPTSPATPPHYHRPLV